MTKARLFTAAATVVVAASLVASLGWAFATIAARPLDGVEGDVLFEADRIRAHLVLYTDPTEGAFDYGPVPARFYVLYPPLWSALLSLVPSNMSAVVGRLVGLASWFGVLAVIVWKAEHRRQAAWVAAFVAGTSTLALYGATARPDALAVLFAGLAVERSTRLARIDVLAGALLATAAFVKPNVVGAAPGLFLLAAVTKRPFARGLAGLVVTAGAIAGILTLATGKVWVSHLLLSTAQPPSLQQLTEQLASRAPFFALPLVAGLVAARSSPLALGALLSSTAWCVMSLAKIGSASNYLMEPCVCLVVVFARAAIPTRSGPAAAVLLLQVLWNDVASIRSAVERVGEAFTQKNALARIREGCQGVVVADEPGLERMLNDRIVQTPFQMTHLGARFPVDRWQSDLSRPDVRCLVMRDDLLERPLETVDTRHDRFAPAMRAFLRSRFELVRSDAGLHWYARRATMTP